MLLGTDELTILRGSKFYGTWQWINSVSGEPEDFAGLSASIKIKNIHEEFAGIKNTFEVGIATVEPLDADSNPFKGRVDITLSKEDTLNFAIPEGEDDRYGESDFYAILEILLSTGEVILQAKVRVVESLESETLNYLIDERSEAIIINGKLDNILARNDEFIATRDNLINIVIPTAINTYNEKIDLYNQNHIEKLDAYNLNHADKLQILEDIATIVKQDKNIVEQDKLDIEAMKQNVLDNKDSVTSMKDAIEVMLDTFDDRFLGRKDSDPLTDNDGNPLEIAALYYNEIEKELKFYNGASWDSPVGAAHTYALQASQSASDANTSKLAAKTSEDNAKASEEVAIEKANAILNLTVEIETLEPNAQATSSYNPLTGVLNIGVPEGVQGKKGDAFIYEDFTPEQLLLLKGPTGLNAYEIAVNNGFVGTEQEWLDSFSSLPTVEEIPELPTSKITGLDITLNQKINISDIKDSLTSTDTTKPLSANQGKVLKELIDNINTIITSDDTTLDQMQEVVNFIKQNKTDLQNLDLSNIAETTTLKHFTATLLTKLNGIADNANNYSHPSTHDASMITESTTKRFVSDTEKNSWNGKLDASGNAATATKLANARNINGSAFDGSGDINIEDRLGTQKASATTTTIGTAGLGDYFHITGTTTITSFGTATTAGIRRTLIFDGALTITHHVTNLICPGAANIVTVPGTVIEVIAETTSSWRVVSITHPNISFTELSYLDGLTGNIQTQLTANAVNATTVANATAGIAAGAVGSYAFLSRSNTAGGNPGTTWAGSSLYYITGGSPSGTWRSMGGIFNSASSFEAITLFLRIA